MVTWRRKLVRNAWTALLLLFAVRAVAGAALCELYGEHRAPPGTVLATAAHAHAEHLLRASQSLGLESPDDAPSSDRSDHACEEPAYLTDGAASTPTYKWSMALDALACCPSPIGDTRLNAADASVVIRQFAYPPPARAPLDISPRLRI